jgi:hypothetical protein
MTIFFRVIFGLSIAYASATAKAATLPIHATDNAVAIDWRLIAEIQNGEEQLIRSLSGCSGTITQWQGPWSTTEVDLFSRAGLKEDSRYCFYALDGSYRIDYLAGAKDNRIVQTLVETPEIAYRYEPSLAANVSIGRLFRVKNPTSTQEHVRIDHQLRSFIDSLVADGDLRPLSLLQRANVKVVATRSLDVPNGFTISLSSTIPPHDKPNGAKSEATPIAGGAASETGTSKLEVVLDRNNNCAICRCKVLTNTADVTSVHERVIRLSRLGDKMIVPREVATATTFAGKSRGAEQHTLREVVRIDYSNSRPDKQRFTEGNLVGLKGKCSVYDIDQRGVIQIGRMPKTIPAADPLPAPSRWSGNQPQDKRNSFLIVNIIAIATLVSIFWIRQRKKRSRQALQ